MTEKAGSYKLQWNGTNHDCKLVPSEGFVDYIQKISVCAIELWIINPETKDFFGIRFLIARISE